MKKGYVVALGAALVLLLTPAISGAWHFDYEIYGNILVSPAEYGGGGLTSGGEGILELTFDETGWPTDTWQTRFSYLWENYFEPNYDSSTPGAYKWVGDFTGSFFIQTFSAPTGYLGWCRGNFSARITIWDWNANGTLDYTEKWGENLFDATLSKLCTHLSGGEMACKWGWGAIASNYFSFVIPPGVDMLYNGADLTLMPGCSTEIRPGSWGSIKALYK
jgi:hypothetical protein